MAGCTNKSPTIPVSPDMAPELTYRITASFPHSSNSFTEGLLFHKGQLFESTGSPEGFPDSESVIGIVNLENGEISEKIKLDKSLYFGEGIVFFKNKLYQLTYKNQMCFVYDATTFKKVGDYRYSNKEGWGLTTDGQQLIMSDGSAVLSYVNPDNFLTTKKITVSENGYAVQYLNELEYIEGFVYANIWMKNEIVKIDPANGHVVGRLDLTGLKNDALQSYSQSQETNGIAYNPETRKILVTGKMWPKFYEIEFTDSP